MAKPLTEFEQECMVKFRKQLSDLDLSRDLFQDRHLIRWLRARDLDIHKAEAMLRKNLEWRDKNDIDTILHSPLPQFILDEYPIEFCGYDKDGGTVLIVRYGKWDIRKLIVDNGMKEEACNMIYHYFEEVYKTLEDKSINGKTFKQFTCIADMEGLSFRQFTSVEIVEVILTCVRAFEANYPESLNCAFVVNAPSIFSILYGMAKPFLSESTARKIQIFGASSKKAIPAILEQVNSDQFPEQYGGSQLHTNSYTSSNGNNYNGNNSSYNVCQDDSEDLAQVTVNAGDSINLYYEVEVPNTILNYAYTTVDYDIGFSMRCEANGSIEEICPYERKNSHLGIQSQSVICENPGRYVLAFDNTYSRLRSKVVRYSVNLCSPEDSEEDEKFTDL